MVSVMSLWLPILVSGVVVFIASSIIHMVLPYHRNDFKKLPSEDDTAEALRKFNIPPGDYVIPYAGSSKAMQSQDYIDKTTNGPVAFVTVLPNGPPAMGGSLVQWFVYSLVVGIFAAYITGLAMGPGTEYMKVFRFAGATAFAGYALALMQNAIWYKRNWTATLKTMFDGLIYGLLTAGVFGWLWPA